MPTGMKSAAVQFVDPAENSSGAHFLHQTLLCIGSCALWSLFAENQATQVFQVTQLHAARMFTRPKMAK